MSCEFGPAEPASELSYDARVGAAYAEYREAGFRLEIVVCSPPVLSAAATEALASGALPLQVTNETSIQPEAITARWYFAGLIGAYGAGGAVSVTAPRSLAEANGYQYEPQTRAYLVRPDANLPSIASVRTNSALSPTWARVLTRS